MTRRRLIELTEQRGRLVAAAQLQREALATMVATGDTVALRGLRIAEGAQKVAQEIRARPLLALAAIATLAALRPRKALGWLVKGWSAWRFFRGARLWFDRLAAGADRAH